MHALLALGRLKWRHLANFLRVQGSSWQTLLRSVGAFLMFAFLRFVTLNILETFRAAGGPSQVVFLATAALLASATMLFVFDLLVFVADEFQIGTEANDFEFLLSLPVGFSTLVWAKVVLRALLDLVGLSTIMPVLVAAALYFELPWYQWPVLYGIYFAIEVSAGLAAVIVFFLLAQVLSMGHLESLRLLAGFALPFVAGAFVSAKAKLLAPQAVAGACEHWGAWVAANPLAWLVAGLAHGSAAAAWPWPMPGLLAGFGSLAAAGALGHQALVRMQGMASSLAPHGQAGDVDPLWQRLFSAAKSPFAALAVKDLAMILRRRVTFITVVVLPLGIVSVNAVTIAGGAAARHGVPAEILTVTTMLVPLLFLPYMTAAQSLGQIEYARIPFLQALPVSARSLLAAKALFWSAPIFVLCEAVHATFLIAYQRWLPLAFLADSAWLLCATVLVTSLAVSTAALFPVSESALFKQQGATLTAGSLFYVTGSLGAIVLVFPLTLTNKLALLSVTAVFAHFTLDRAAERLEHFDEADLVSSRPGLHFGEVFIAFDAYICVYLMTNIGIALLTGIGAQTQLMLTTVALLASQLAIAAMARSYLARKGYSVGAAWQSRWQAWPTLGAAALAGALTFLPFGLTEHGGSPARALEALLDPASGPAATLFLVAALVSGPMCEEVFFRGLLLRSLMATTGRPLAALVGSALLFGVPHYFASGHFLPAAALGLATGSVFLAGGGLMASIGVHAGFNAASLARVLPTTLAQTAGAALTVTCLTLVAAAGHRFTKSKVVSI